MRKDPTKRIGSSILNLLIRNKLGLRVVDYIRKREVYALSECYSSSSGEKVKRSKIIEG